MRIVQLSGMPYRLGRQVGALNWLNGDPPYDAKLIGELPALNLPSTDYRGLFAVGAGQLLGKIDPTVPSFVTAVGTEP